MRSCLTSGVFDCAKRSTKQAIDAPIQKNGCGNHAERKAELQWSGKAVRDQGLQTQQLPKKIDLLTEVQRLRKAHVIQVLRQEFSLTILPDIAQLPRATFYYHLKWMDKYKLAKQKITAIYYENRGRYGYRRITMALHGRNMSLNHKTVQRLMKELGLTCRVRMKKYRSYKGEVGKIAPNLLNRDFHVGRPNQK